MYTCTGIPYWLSTAKHCVHPIQDMYECDCIDSMQWNRFLQEPVKDESNGQLISRYFTSICKGV